MSKEAVERAQVVSTTANPTTDERYRHMRENAEAFIQSMQAMVAAAERTGDEDMASKLRVWCLMPWEAAIRADNTGELWSLCEVCGEPIKNDADHAYSDDCNFHRSCVES